MRSTINEKDSVVSGLVMLPEIAGSGVMKWLKWRLILTTKLRAYEAHFGRVGEDNGPGVEIASE